LHLAITAVAVLHRAPKRGLRHSGLIALSACYSPLGGKRLHFVTRRRRPSPRCNSAAQRRQRLRRRITPNSNTRTTTMINTHNHPDMAASLVGAGAGRGDATAAHPGKQLGHGQAVTWAGIGGCAARGLAGTPAPPRPTRRSGLAGRVPDRQPTTRWCRWGRALRATPGQPSPSRIDQHHQRRPGRRQPTRRDHSEPDRRGRRGREEFALLGWGNNPSWLC
jgi:hypothetical protein